MSDFFAPSRMLSETTLLSFKISCRLYFCVVLPPVGEEPSSGRHLNYSFTDPNSRDFILNFFRPAVVTVGYQQSVRPSVRGALCIVTQPCSLACMMFVIDDVVVYLTFLFCWCVAFSYGGLGAYYLALFVFTVGRGLFIPEFSVPVCLKAVLFMNFSFQIFSYVFAFKKIPQKCNISENIFIVRNTLAHTHTKYGNWIQ